LISNENPNAVLSDEVRSSKFVVSWSRLPFTATTQYCKH
jgi:hypothetical protein